MFVPKVILIGALMLNSKAMWYYYNINQDESKYSASLRALYKVYGYGCLRP